MTGKPAQVIIRSMRPADLPVADELRAAAGWNQTPADWMRLLQYEPEGCFAAFPAEADGGEEPRISGTVTTTCYGTELAWIGMMLVHPDLRGRGIASQLMKHALAHLNGRGIRCIMLDATPAGEPVYRRLEFEHEWTFFRWHRSGEATREQSARVQGSAGQPANHAFSSLSAACRDLDRKAFGTDRSLWLKRLLQDSLDTLVIDDGKNTGFGMVRPGRNAACLGPVVASSPEVADRIIRTLLQNVDGPVFWDIPQTGAEAEWRATALGFEKLRPLSRMRWRSEKIRPDIALQYAIADPATG